MDDGVSLDRLRDAATDVRTAEVELVRLVRLADQNGIPKATIGKAIGVSRETVRRWCDEGEQ